MANPSLAAEIEWPAELDAVEAAPYHHAVLFENNAVRVLETRLASGEIVPLHTHCWPGISYFLSWSDCVRRGPDGSVLLDSRASAMPLASPAAWSVPLPPHTLENVGACELRVITVELKRH